jgi:LysR family transcriptional regulator, glycine cleavage system transcriptional activator
MSPGTLPPFAVLRAFDRVGRLGGIRKAAVSLQISHAIVSRHMASLETFLGVTLYNRRTGELTEAGCSYHSRISAAISDMEAATNAARVSRARSLTIWCSAGFSLHWLAQRLPDFRAKARERDAPLIDLHSTDTEPSFRLNEADGDIRYLFDDAATNLPNEIRAEEIARPVVFPVIAPSYRISRNGGLMKREDILDLPMIHERSNVEWARWLEAQRLNHRDSQPVARYGQAHLALVAARSGQGIALANHFLVADDLASGRLIKLVPDDRPWEPARLGAYYFRCSRPRWNEPLVARFRRWLHRAVAEDVQA